MGVRNFFFLTLMHLTLLRIVDRSQICKLLDTIEHLHVRIIVVAHFFDVIALLLCCRLLVLENLATGLLYFF